MCLRGNRGLCEQFAWLLTLVLARSESYVQCGYRLRSHHDCTVSRGDYQALSPCNAPLEMVVTLPVCLE